MIKSTDLAPNNLQWEKTNYNLNYKICPNQKLKLKLQTKS